MNQPLMAGGAGPPMGQSTFKVVLPPGSQPGQTLQSQAPDGQMVQFVVPPGHGPGQEILVPYNAFVAQAMPVAAPPQQQFAVQQQFPPQQVMGQGGRMPNYMAFEIGQPMDPYAILGRFPSLKIKEKVQLAEILVGFEQPEKYMISDPSSNMDLFIAAERGNGMLGVLGRNVMSGGSRPFTLDIGMLVGPGQPPVNFVTLERPFACTCCCLNRPEVDVINAITGMKIGSVVEPFACCSYNLVIKDASGAEVLEIKHGCCDCSLMCWGCPCGCQETDFQIYDKNGSTVGHIRRQFNMEQAMGALTGVHVDADQFRVDFQDVQHPEWKAMILATALFLDFCYFVKSGQEARDESALGRVAQNSDGVANAMGPAAGLWGGNRDRNN